MFPRRTRLPLLAALIIPLLAAACSRPSEPNRGKPPAAEFLVSSDDSTFWVSTRGGTTSVRGAPLMLARYGGRFYELYTADDDFSFDDAQLVGERLYRRDLMTGDSAVVFVDTIVPRIAAAYARAHPDERPLEPDEDGEANPSTSATAELDVLDVFGPFVSYEYRVDVQLPGRDPWHSTRRGVIDLRSGKASRASDVFGAAEGQVLETNGNRSYLAARDSLLRDRDTLGADDRIAAGVLQRLQFDPRSFTIADEDGRPTVAFGVPGRGAGAAGDLVELDPMSVPPPAWWGTIRNTLPTTDDQDADIWSGPGYRVIARYDTSGDDEIARLSLADSSRREWPLGALLAPVHRIDWLDRPVIGPADRKALLRAFNAAASYDETARVAALPSIPRDRRERSAVSLFHLASIHARHEDRSRKSARDVRAHDARACQQHGACVRRRDPVDDGQDRGHRRVSTQPRRSGHRVDRSRRLSRAHSPG